MLPPKPRDRIKLIYMPDGPHPVPVGSTGTVTSIHLVASGRGTWYQVSVDWDNGRKLMLTVPPDRFEVLSGDAQK